MVLRILLVDDDPIVLEVSRSFFEDKGHEVIASENPTLLPCCIGRECQQAHPCADMILIDFSMPRMNGLEFLELQRERGCKLSHTNKFIVTGEPGRVDQGRAEKICAAVLSKPLSFPALGEVLSQVESGLDPKRKLADLT